MADKDDTDWAKAAETLRAQQWGPTKLTVYPTEQPVMSVPSQRKSKKGYSHGGGVTRFKDDHCGHYDMKRGGSVKGKC